MNPNLNANIVPPTKVTTETLETRAIANAIYIDARQGTLPLTALIDCGNNLLRMSKDGQVVIIQSHTNSMTLNIKLTRIGMGNFAEEITAEQHGAKQMI